MSVGIFFLLFIVGVPLLMAVASVLIVARVSPAKAAQDGGACGKCGYGVRGIESLACPECGADLREVGIVGQARPRPGVFVLASVMWLAAMSAMGFAAGGVLIAILDFAPGDRTGPLLAMVGTLAVVMLACGAGVVWMGRRTRAGGAAVVGVLLLWGFCVLGLLVMLGALRF